jgi:hypothetical protein
MMNPLQAMVAARQANQMTPVGVQSQGAQELNPLLAYANMNTPARPQMMNAPATQLREVDKYKYIDSALNRDQRNKEAVWNIMQEQTRHQNVLDAQKQQDQLVRKRQEDSIAIEVEKNRALTALADEQYAPLRGQVTEIANQYQAWINGEMELERERLYTEQSGRFAEANVPRETVIAAFAEKGFTPEATPKPGTPAYRKKALEILGSTEEGLGQLAGVKAMVDRDIAQQNSNYASSFKSAMDTVRTLRFSLSGGAQGGGGGALMPTQEKPIKANINTIDPANDFDFGGGGPKPKAEAEEDPYFILDAPKNTLEAAQAMINWAKENPDSAGTLGIVGLGSMTATELLSRPDFQKIQAKFAEDLDFQASETDITKTRTVKDPQTKISRKEMNALKGERADLQKKLKDQGLSRGERKNLNKKLTEVNNKIDKANSYRVEDTGETKKLTGAAKKVKARSIAPQVMMEHAKKLDPNGLGKKDLDFFKKLDPEEFGKTVSKAKGGWLSRLGRLGLKTVTMDDGEGGRRKINLDDFKKSKKLQGAGWIGAIFAALDFKTWLMSPGNESEKQKIVSEGQAILEAEKSIHQSMLQSNAPESEDQRSRIDELIGQPSPLRP